MFSGYIGSLSSAFRNLLCKRLFTGPGYTAGYTDNNTYLVNPQTGASSLVASLPGNPGLEGISLATSTTAYVVGNNDSTVRVVDLQTGASSIVTTISGDTSLENIAVNDSTAYVVDNNNSHIYVVNLLNDNYSTIEVVTGDGLNGIDMPGIVLNGMAILLPFCTKK